MDRKKKIDMPATPEPPQRMYPVPQSVKVKGKEKSEENRREKNNRRKK